MALALFGTISVGKQKQGSKEHISLSEILLNINCLLNWKEFWRNSKESNR